ncbi:CaiB/BaiF CoA transferase family protein [Blastococcus capsensis]|uniref:CaiB/BaiF CoA transferase family protein n=2 Tax=Bacillati TaxID=1783272 RepID=UPI002541639C|nr:CoA transferase [Blastococcus capsensis]MDK3257778.1 CoA transferase [Blastococcus capsensis]
MTASAPLAGVRVVELGDDGGLVEFGGKLLADLGADVVKVEPPGGVASRRIPPFHGGVADPDRSLQFWFYNGSKRSVVLDPADASAPGDLRRLLHDAGVVLDGSSTPVLDRLGITASSLERDFPGLVYCRVSPFGDTGPLAGHQSSDLVQLALGGVMAACGYDDVPGAPPIAPSGGQSAHLTGMAIATGVIAALVHRQRTGRGQMVDIAAHDVVSVSTEMSFAYWEYQQVNPRRQTGRHARPYDSPPWNHRCLDGKYFCTLPLYLTNERYAAMVKWFEDEGMAEDLADPVYASDEGRASRMSHVVAVISRFCAARDSSYLFTEAQKRRLPWAPVNSPHDLLDDPHLRDRGAYCVVEHEDVGASLTYPGAPYKLSATPWRPPTAAPRLGEHTAQLLPAPQSQGERK